MFQVPYTLVFETRVRKPSQRSSCHFFWPMSSRHEHGAEEALLLMLRNASEPCPWLRHSPGQSCISGCFPTSHGCCLASQWSWQGAEAWSTCRGQGMEGGSTFRGRGEEGAPSEAASADGGYAALKGRGCCCFWSRPGRSFHTQSPWALTGLSDFPGDPGACPAVTFVLGSFLVVTVGV